MNSKIYLSTLKLSKKFLATFIVCVVLLLLSLIVIFPILSSNSSYSVIINSMPKDMLSGMGIQGDIRNLNDYLNMHFYNAAYLYILMVFIIVFTCRLIARPISDTSMVYYLNSSISRQKVLGSQIAVFITGLLSIYLTSIIAGAMGKILLINKYKLNIVNFFKINTSIIAIFLLLGSICILINAVSISEKQALNYCSIIIIAEYLIDMIGKMSEKIVFMRKFSVFSIYNPQRILNSNYYFIGSVLIFILSSCLICFISIKLFNKRELYL